MSALDHIVRAAKRSSEGKHLCRIALTGGPGGGKTTAADMLRREIGERVVVARFPDRVLLCDRGTIDGAAYWPSSDPEEFVLIHHSNSFMAKIFEGLHVLGELIRRFSNGDPEESTP